MKKWITFFLVLALTIGLYAGCANQQANTETPTQASEEAAETQSLEEGLKSISPYMVEDLTGADDARLDAVVATCGDYELTNRGLQFYFWMEYLNFINGIAGYGVDPSAFGLDTAQPMSEQSSITEGLNWEQYFLQAALDRFHEDAAVAMTAKAAGFELPEDLVSSIETLPDDLNTQAASYGFEDGESFVQDTFGPGSSVQGYQDYIRLYYLAASYENEIYGSLDYTDEELSAYYDENAEAMESAGVTKDDSITLINVRHILISWDDADGDGEPTEEEKAAALESAEAILTEYQKDPTEDHFAQLANEHSTDPGSNTNGGLYENVSPGYMVQEFNDWCFDASRQTGDTDIVETQFGYHIMYFVSHSDTPYWKQYIIDQGYLTTKMDKMVADMSEQYPVSVQFDQIVLGKSPIYGE